MIKFFLAKANSSLKRSIWLTLGEELDGRLLYTTWHHQNPPRQFRQRPKKGAHWPWHAGIWFDAVSVC